jgi:adenine phosphoribosyltransferase
MTSPASLPALIAAHVRSIPDFPKPGILFRDITSVWKHPPAFEACIRMFEDRYRHDPIDQVVGIESRGFVFGAAYALRTGRGFVPIRKRGKLPAEVHSHEYELEYGTDCVEIHRDALAPGQSVVVMDDLLATGGTLFASIELLKKLGVKIAGCAVVIDLPDLGGSRKIREAGYDVFSILEFPGH